MKLQLILKLLLLFLTVNCYSQTIRSDIKVNRKKIPKGSNVSYIPIKYFPQYTWEVNKDSLIEKILPNQFDTSAVKLFTEFLIKANEPILFNQETTSEIYRFVWLRTFDEPIIIRLDRKNNIYKITWKIFEGKAGYGIEGVKMHNKRALTSEEWFKFIDLLNSSTFGKKSFSRNIMPPEDGSEWLLERINKKVYCAASANSPSKGPFYSACMYLIELTNITLNERDKY